MRNRNFKKIDQRIRDYMQGTIEITRDDGSVIHLAVLGIEESDNPFFEEFRVKLLAEPVVLGSDTEQSDQTSVSLSYGESIDSMFLWYVFNANIPYEIQMADFRFFVINETAKPHVPHIIGNYKPRNRRKKGKGNVC